MRKIILTLLVSLTLFSYAFALHTDKWNELKSDHFIIYYKHAPESFIKEISDKSERFYNEIANELGFNRFDFWLWDNRAKIYIYDDAADYQKTTGQPKWSGGAAIPKEKTIYSFLYAQGFSETVLPHEMGHIIFREFVGFDNYAIPIWLDEGVASHQQKEKFSMADRVTKEAIENNSFMDLRELTGFNPQLSRENNKIGTFYLEAFSVVSFLINEFGRDKFVLFCQNLRDKKNFNIALSSSYPFEDIKQLNEAWVKYLRGK
ncbi:MAG: peptidase MA family metallohydrolase [Candidatus Omnitrophica bacterium]|nr:peptidase MA family metallohydrolase [Candidatus Omnitrophota bacterium]